MQQYKVNLKNKAIANRRKLNLGAGKSQQFRRNQTKKPTFRKNSSKNLFKIILGIGIILIIVFGVLRFNILGSRMNNSGDSKNKTSCKSILNPECWTDAFKPQLKQTDGFTNALIIGLDSRKEGRSAGLMNTDTIIIASFNHETEETMLISIPRDFYIPEYKAKINAVYALTYKIDDSDPFKSLRETVEKIIGKPIHYTAKVKLEGVIQAIDAIGGVEVCPADAFTAQYPIDYPNPGDPGWSYHEFTAGCQTLNGENTLIYSRFRYVSSGPKALASDYSRARRQQEVIEGVKNKLLSEDLSITQRAEKYLSLIDTYKDNVTINISLEDILAGLRFIDSADRDPINIILDPAFGGKNKFLIEKSYNVEPKDPTYLELQNEISAIWTYSDFYREKPLILIRNVSGTALSEDDTLLKFSKEAKSPAGVFLEDGKTVTSFSGIKVFDFSNGAKPKSLEYLLKYLNVSTVEAFPPEEFGVARSNKNEDILIVLGPKLVASPTNVQN